MPNDDEPIPFYLKARQEDRRVMPIVMAGVSLLAIAVGGFLYRQEQGRNAREAQTLYIKAVDERAHDLPDAALTDVNAALDLRETTPALVLKASLLIAKGNDAEAKTVYDRLMQRDPRNADYAAKAGLMAYNEADNAEAAREFRIAARLAPQNNAYQMSLGNALVNNGNYPEAIAAFQSVLHRSPHLDAAWGNAANAYYQANQPKKAIALLQDGARRYPKDDGMAYLLAGMYDRTGDAPHAVDYYRRSLELRPLQNSIAAMRIFDLTGKHVSLKLEAMHANTVPFRRQDRLMLVQAVLNGHRGRFLLDTGASTSVIFGKARQYYALQDTGRVETANTPGGMIQAPVGTGTLDFGRHRFDDHPFVIIAHDANPYADGIIGMDIMRNFRFEIDNNRQQIIIKD